MTNQHADNYSLIALAANNIRPKMLLLHEEDGWTMPWHTYTQPAEINAAMKAQFGLTTTVLSCIYDRYKDDEREEQHRVYALENHALDVSPPINGRWVERSELRDLALMVPEHRAVIATWFAEIEEEEVRERRQPWAFPGWFNQATTWIDQQLGQLGYTRTAPVEQVVVWTWSTVLRVPTTAGNLYFKATAAVFDYEPELTRMVAQFASAYVPHVLAIDKQQCWMLMGDAGTLFRKGPHDPARSAEALRRYAQMQIKLADHVETLKATGCPDRRLHLLPGLYQEVLAATPFLLLDEPGGLPRDQYEQLLHLLPQVREMCEELASYNIPQSFHHDDLHSANTMDNGETFVFIDLAECCLTHPFCSLFIALRDAKYILEYDDRALDHLRKAYLAEWTAYEPMERLLQAFELAHRLGSLQRALTWYRFLSHLEPEMRWMHKDAVLYFLQVFLGTEE